MTIHNEHPFTPGPEERDPVRRLRGRLAAPVTIVTSGAGDHRAGLTVSSLFVVEGNPGVVHAIVTPNS
ncbi:MAG TPA: flavin reductase, partial [Acidimicrobiia bacterium]|nr:flavin reductase [Acidimicrobiia bacterium]